MAHTVIVDHVTNFFNGLPPKFLPFFERANNFFLQFTDECWGNSCFFFSAVCAVVFPFIFYFVVTDDVEKGNMNWFEKSLKLNNHDNRVITAIACVLFAMFVLLIFYGVQRWLLADLNRRFNVLYFKVVQVCVPGVLAVLFRRKEDKKQYYVGVVSFFLCGLLCQLKMVAVKTNSDQVLNINQLITIQCLNMCFVCLTIGVIVPAGFFFIPFVVGSITLLPWFVTYFRGPSAEDGSDGRELVPRTGA